MLGMEALLMPVLEHAHEPGPEGIADRAALLEQGVLPALRRLAVNEDQPSNLHLYALLWCVHASCNECDV